MHPTNKGFGEGIMYATLPLPYACRETISGRPSVLSKHASHNSIEQKKIQ